MGMEETHREGGVLSPHGSYSAGAAQYQAVDSPQ